MAFSALEKEKRKGFLMSACVRNRSFEVMTGAPGHDHWTETHLTMRSKQEETEKNSFFENVTTFVYIKGKLFGEKFS